MDAITIAKSVIDKAVNTGKHYAIFVRNGQAKVTNTGTDLFREAMQKREADLLGVYDQNCRLEWLVDDLRYKGVL